MNLSAILFIILIITENYPKFASSVGRFKRWRKKLMCNIFKDSLFTPISVVSVKNRIENKKYDPELSIMMKPLLKNEQRKEEKRNEKEIKRLNVQYDQARFKVDFCSVRILEAVSSETKEKYKVEKMKYERKMKELKGAIEKLKSIKHDSSHMTSNTKGT